MKIKVTLTLPTPPDPVDAVEAVLVRLADECGYDDSGSPYMPTRVEVESVPEDGVPYVSAKASRMDDRVWAEVEGRTES